MPSQLSPAAASDGKQGSGTLINTGTLTLTGSAGASALTGITVTQAGGNAVEPDSNGASGSAGGNGGQVRGTTSGTVALTGAGLPDRSAARALVVNASGGTGAVEKPEDLRRRTGGVGGSGGVVKVDNSGGAGGTGNGPGGDGVTSDGTDPMIKNSGDISIWWNGDETEHSAGDVGRRRDRGLQFRRRRRPIDRRGKGGNGNGVTIVNNGGNVMLDVSLPAGQVGTGSPASTGIRAWSRGGAGGYGENNSAGGAGGAASADVATSASQTSGSVVVSGEGIVGILALSAGGDAGATPAPSPSSTAGAAGAAATST